MLANPLRKTYLEIVIYFGKTILLNLIGFLISITLVYYAFHNYQKHSKVTLLTMTVTDQSAIDLSEITMLIFGIVALITLIYALFYLFILVGVIRIKMRAQ